jgi:putative redox protein
MPLLQLQLTAPDYGFTLSDYQNQSMKMDIPVDQGGNGDGFRPMQLLLGALCGCSAVDVVAILKKQRQQLTDLSITVDGERQQGKEPALWEKVALHFSLFGEIEPEKAYRSVQLSIDKYCSVAETLRLAGAAFTWTVSLNDQLIHSK